MARWRPSPFLQASALVHAGAAAGLLANPAWWPAAAGALVANHAALTVAGLLPRSRLLGPNLTHLPAGSNEIVISIDDGPDPEVTPRVLDQLAAADARATFFCIGRRAASHPALVRDIVAAGHTIENHSEHHWKRFSTLGPGAMAREIAAAQDTLGRLAGRQPRYFRAPAGLRNPFLDPILARLDLRLASWTRRAYDTRTGDPQRVLSRLCSGLGGGDILLLHDGNAARTPAGRPVILEVLPTLLARIRDAGLSTTPLP
ncbi:polysaccharide deacetylase family protein [Zoogloea dura]|uniref:Polysaccharide deacetylase family protein n=1 Tax=Zoogloea dura TaxID=2728840 RepID=A0A848G3N5_9RHOO|nr:polysaccharide deacetylase family protein [Zoogloea dura]NML25832.1 polysaccharide deacetylase family protein [Zoogloea dura]